MVNQESSTDDEQIVFVNLDDEMEKDTKKKSIPRQFSNAIVQILRNPCSRWTLVAGSFRFFGGYCIAFYKPTYFQNVFCTHSIMFGYLDAILASTLGFISTVSGGLLSDKFHKYSYWTKPAICIVTSALATPAIFLCTYYQHDFNFSIIMLGLNYVFAEAWGSPTITMLQDVTPNETMGFSISAYLFMTTISGMIATASLGQVQIWVDAENNIDQYGYTLCYFTVISYAGSIPFFWLAGRSYVQ